MAGKPWSTPPAEPGMYDHKHKRGLNRVVGEAKSDSVGGSFVARFKATRARRSMIMSTHRCTTYDPVAEKAVRGAAITFGSAWCLGCWDQLFFTADELDKLVKGLQAIQQDLKNNT